MTQKNETINQPSQPKVFDVTRPGSSRPNTSSRPIIVTHRPMIQDPMVTKDQRDDTSAATVKTAPELPSAQPAEKPQPKPVVDAMQAESKKQEQQTEPPKTADEPVTVTVAAAGTTIETTTAPMLPSDKTTPTDESSSAAEADAASSEVGASDADTSEDTVPSNDEATTPESTETSTTTPTDQTPPTSKEKASQDVDVLLHEDDLETRVLHDLKDITYDALPPASAETAHMGHAIAICAIILLVVIVVCLDVLLDAGALTIPGLPHTHFINTYQP